MGCCDRDDHRDPRFGVDHSGEVFLHGETVLDERNHCTGMFLTRPPRFGLVDRLTDL